MKACRGRRKTEKGRLQEEEEPKNMRMKEGKKSRGRERQGKKEMLGPLQLTFVSWIR